MLANIRKRSALVMAGCALTVGVAFSAIAPQPAMAEGEVAENVQTGIDNATATVEALGPLALAALVVALTPMGAMLTLRFLNMVLSRV